MSARRRRTLRRRRGFTIVEMLMSLVITALIGLAATSLAVSAASGWEQTEESASISTRLERSTRYMESAIDSSNNAWSWRAAGSPDADVDEFMMTWRDGFLGPITDDSIIQLSEIQLFRYDPDTDRLYAVLSEPWEEMSFFERGAALIPLTGAAFDNLEATADFFEGQSFTFEVPLVGPTPERVTAMNFTIDRENPEDVFVGWSMTAQTTLGTRVSQGAARVGEYMSDSEQSTMAARDTLDWRREHLTSIPTTPSTGGGPEEEEEE
ncbi:MAG: prepilin-type N-terminal cleavage/methylation domain-containing protein [Planctomycetota bacterium]